MNLLSDPEVSRHFKTIGQDPENLFSPLLDSPLCLSQTLEVLKCDTRHLFDKSDTRPGSRFATREEADLAGLLLLPAAPLRADRPMREGAPPPTRWLEGHYIDKYRVLAVIFPNDTDEELKLMLYARPPASGFMRVIYTVIRGNKARREAHGAYVDMSEPECDWDSRVKCGTRRGCTPPKVCGKSRGPIKHGDFSTCCGCI